MRCLLFLSLCLVFPFICCSQGWGDDSDSWASEPEESSPSNEQKKEKEKKEQLEREKKEKEKERKQKEAEAAQKAKEEKEKAVKQEKPPSPQVGASHRFTASAVLFQCGLISMWHTRFTFVFTAQHCLHPTLHTLVFSLIDLNQSQTHYYLPLFCTTGQDTPLSQGTQITQNNTQITPEDP